MSCVKNFVGTSGRIQGKPPGGLKLNEIMFDWHQVQQENPGIHPQRTHDLHLETNTFDFYR